MENNIKNLLWCYKKAGSIYRVHVIDVFDFEEKEYIGGTFFKALDDKWYCCGEMIVKSKNSCEFVILEDNFETEDVQEGVVTNGIIKKTKAKYNRVLEPSKVKFLIYENSVWKELKSELLYDLKSDKYVPFKIPTAPYSSYAINPQCNFYFDDIDIQPVAHSKIFETPSILCDDSYDSEYTRGKGSTKLIKPVIFDIDFNLCKFKSAEIINIPMFVSEFWVRNMMNGSKQIRVSFYNTMLSKLTENPNDVEVLIKAIPENPDFPEIEKIVKIKILKFI